MDITPQTNPEKTVKDTRIPIPEAANRIVDEAKMHLADQQKFLFEILRGGLSDAEIYRRLALINDLSHKAANLLSAAQCVGKSAAKIAEEMSASVKEQQ